MTLRIIGGKYKGRVLKIPKGNSTRPTQGMLREAVFNICQGQIENARFLDLYAGSGAVGFEALSRGAAHVTFVERNRQAIECIKENIAMLEVASSVGLIPLDAKIALQRLVQPFDLIYIDPPYDLPIVSILKTILVLGLLVPGGMLFLEERYDPKKNPIPFQDSKLELKRSRRFGEALLHQYLKSI